MGKYIGIKERYYIRLAVVLYYHKQHFLSAFIRLSFMLFYLPAFLCI
ncbi:MAG TPA: hypothetical protein PK239_16975 [Chitinophagales bacterium]|nr:hypothetical protein [Chitinophagales bacterium]HRK28969.1 hypothetical protein [Chitinophagales bacterium]